MEIWKIHKFAETASLEELRAKEKQLVALIDQGKASATNARHILELVREYIELKELF